MLGNAIAEFGVRNPKINGLLKESIKEVEQALRESFARAIDQGFLAENKNPTAMAQSLIVMIQGLALLSKLGYAKEMHAGVMNSVQEILTG